MLNFTKQINNYVLGKKWALKHIVENSLRTQEHLTTGRPLAGTATSSPSCSGKCKSLMYLYKILKSDFQRYFQIWSFTITALYYKIMIILRYQNVYWLPCKPRYINPNTHMGCCFNFHLTKKKIRSIHMFNLNRQLVKNQLIKTLKPLILFHFKWGNF